MRNRYLSATLFTFLILAVSSLAGADMAKVKEFRIERGMSEQARACIECHKTESPGIFADWANSRHASANITCLDCHQAEEHDADVSDAHYKQYQRSDSKWGKQEYRMPVAAAVTPKDCSRCHPDEVKQYSKSKHANTMEIIWKLDPWLNKGMNSDWERTAGCYYCHGTILKKDKDGKLDASTVFPWPRPASPRHAASATWGRTTRRSKSTPSPSTGPSPRPTSTNTAGTPHPAPGPQAWTTAHPAARPATCRAPAKSSARMT
jgi:hypothetical protein